MIVALAPLLIEILKARNGAQCDQKALYSRCLPGNEQIDPLGTQEDASLELQQTALDFESLTQFRKTLELRKLVGGDVDDGKL